MTMGMKLISVGTLVLVVCLGCAWAQSGKVVFGDDGADSSRQAPEEGLRYAPTARDLGPNVNLTGVPQGGPRRGKNLLSWLGLGTGPEVDPYLKEANQQCLVGDLYECFKSRALSSLDEFFITTTTSFPLTENARIKRFKAAGDESEGRARSFEFSAVPRAQDSEWDRFVKFLLRRVETFLRSAGLELEFPSQVTDGGRYSPRFLDEIASELDVIEDKNASPLHRTKLKKLFIPLLVILKLFKLKLLLFLPLILGLASFKKLLGFLALAIPGIIGFFKLCRPNLSQTYGSYGHSSFYQPPPHSYNGPYSSSSSLQSISSPYYNRDGDFSASSGSVAFREPSSDTDAHNLAYQGYSHYQNKK